MADKKKGEGAKRRRYIDICRYIVVVCVIWKNEKRI